MKFTHIITDDSATVVIGNRVFTISAQSANYADVCQLVNDPTVTPDRMIAACSPGAWLKERTVNHGTILVENGQVFHRGTAVNNVLTDRILAVARAGGDVEAWVKFADKVYSNPATWAREELFLWMEKNSLPMTPDGNFVAYKKIRNDYRDIYSGRFDNSPGQWVTLENREKVDPNRNNTCSTGLHFCSQSYLPSFGSSSGNRVVLVEVDPFDVVSIPNDYDNAKGRCWRYKVTGEIPEEQARDMLWYPVTHIDPVFLTEDGDTVDDMTDRIVVEPVDPAPIETDSGSVTAGVKSLIQRFITRMHRD